MVLHVHRNHLGLTGTGAQDAHLDYCHTALQLSVKQVCECEEACDGGPNSHNKNEDMGSFNVPTTPMQTKETGTDKLSLACVHERGLGVLN